jgi:hypothetical protein
VPHTPPSLAQAPHVGLDRASPKALRILGELGKLDGDFDAASESWASPGISAMVADMFLDMPAIDERPRAEAERRARNRVVRNVPLGAGLILKDQSATGACLLITGSPPALGSQFAFAGDDGPISGRVRWIQRIHDDAALFGLETDAAEQARI